MDKQILLTVSHAPFWHDGKDISTRSVNLIFAAMFSVVPGIFIYGIPAVSVVCLAVGSAMAWELLMNIITRRQHTIGDGNAALYGLIFGMLCPATVPWWFVITGTFITIIIGKQVFGGIGANPFHPALIGIAIISISWGDMLDFNDTLSTYDFSYSMIYPLTAFKYFGAGAVENFTFSGLLLGKQAGGIGTTFNLGLFAGGFYLLVRGFIRWEISISFLAGIFLTALIFSISAPDSYAGPVFHLFTGYTVIGAFFIATDDSSSPVNLIPMFIYGAGGGVMTVLIRNLGAHVDGVVYAIILMNLFNPVIDKIRPNSLRKAGQ